MNLASKALQHSTSIGTEPSRGNCKLRLLDRYLGIPLVAAFGAMRRKNSVPPLWARIGILNTAAIGDTILMSGSIADLREAKPDCEIILLVGPSNYEAAQMIDGTDTVVKLPVFNPLASIKDIRRQRLDLLLDFGPWSRLNALLSIFSGASFIAGFRTPGQHRHFGYDLAVEHSAQNHELTNYARMIQSLDIKPTHRPTLRPLSDEEDFDLHLGSFVVLHMWPGGTGAELKEWPATRWLVLTEELTKLGLRIVLTGSATQRALNDQLIKAMEPSIKAHVVNVAGANLADTSRLLSRAELVVSVNTGIMHLADTLGVRLVALHGPTNARRWGPTSDTSVSLESKLNGSGYLNLGFEYPRNPPKCMEAISLGEVLDACHSALRLSNRSAGSMSDGREWLAR